MHKNGFVIYGSGGHATSLIGCLQREGIEVLEIIDEFATKESLFDIPVKKSFPKETKGSRFLIAIGDNFNRYNISNQVIAMYGIESIGTFVSSNTYISKSVDIGRGSVIMPGSYIGACARVSIGAIINTGAIVEHECHLSDFVSIAPHATLAGSARIGKLSHVSLGSLVDAKISVGSNCVLGANSYLREDLEDNCVAIGNPAKFYKKREIGEKFLK
jgi:acetyltransferase EpsM